MKPIKNQDDAKKSDLQQKTVSVLSDNQLNAIDGKNEESGPAGYLFQVAGK